MFQNFHRWLNGSFTCRKCGELYHGMTFGFGEIICPQCYNGENKFIFFDNKYWLNRFLERLQKVGTSQPAIMLDDIIMGQEVINSEINDIEH